MGGQGLNFGQLHTHFPITITKFSIKMWWRTHKLTIYHVCTMCTHTLNTHSNTHHTPTMRSRADHTLLMYSRTCYQPTIQSHIGMHSSHTHALTTCSHVRHSITTQSLNAHGFITHSAHTPPSPHSLPTDALTHTLQTHLLVNTLTTPTHHPPLQWSPQYFEYLGKFTW